MKFMGADVLLAKQRKQKGGLLGHIHRVKNPDPARVFEEAITSTAETRTKGEFAAVAPRSALVHLTAIQSTSA